MVHPPALLSTTIVRAMTTDSSDQPVCFVTTIGRVSGREHVIEIWYVECDCGIYVFSGYGEGADWVKNLRATPEASVSLAPSGPDGPRSPAMRHVAAIGPFEDEQPIRQAVDARYHGWQHGEPLTAWAQSALAVRLRRDEDA